jgi:hypothetical protein
VKEDSNMSPRTYFLAFGRYVSPSPWSLFYASAKQARLLHLSNVAKIDRPNFGSDWTGGYADVGATPVTMTGRL